MNLTWPELERSRVGDLDSHDDYIVWMTGERGSGDAVTIGGRVCGSRNRCCEVQRVVKVASGLEFAREDEAEVSDSWRVREA